MTQTIKMDASGRLVLPKQVRERLNLHGSARLQFAVVSGHLELVPVAEKSRPRLKQKSGLTVIARTGKVTDAAAALAAERADSEARGSTR